MKKIFNLLLCLLILFSLTGCKKDVEESTNNIGLNEEFTNSEEETTYTYKKSDLETDKVETVYVDADSSGNVEKIEVETTLKSKLEGDIKDAANLDNIINTSGDENYTIKDGVIYFENHGKDITYKGNTNKELPVNIKLTYYLDGNLIEPSELAHKSGHVKVEFKYNNNSYSDYSNIKVPFICISLIMLDDEKFSNVTVENGKLLSMSDNKIVTLYGEPGLKDSLQLYKVDTFDDIKLTDTAYFEADVEDFTLDYTATVVSNGLFDEVEDEDINDISNSINDLSDLNNKIDDIKDATNKLKDSSKELVDGVGKLNDGASQLNDGIQQYKEGIKAIGTLTEGMASLAFSIDTLAKNESSTLDTIKQLAEGLNTYVNTYETLLSQISNLANSINYDDSNNLSEDTINAIEQLKEIGNNVSSNEFIQLKEGVNTLLNTLNSEETANNIKALTDNASLLNKSASDLNSNDKKKALIDGISAIGEGSSSLKEGVNTLNDNMPKLTDGVNEFSDKLNDAIDDSRDDLNKLSGSNMKNIINNLKNTKKVDSEYDSFVGKLDGMTSSVSFIIETGEIK